MIAVVYLGDALGTTASLLHQCSTKGFGTTAHAFKHVVVLDMESTALSCLC